MGKRGPRSSIASLTLLIGLPFASSSLAAPLYLLGSQSPTLGFGIYTVDPQTAASTRIVPLGLELRAGYDGLAYRPGDDSALYTTWSKGVIQGNTIVFQSEIRRVDLATQAVTTIYTFDPADVGLTNAFVLNLAIDPLHPNLAVASVFNGDPSAPLLRAVVTIDLTTGATGPLVSYTAPGSAFSALTYGLDGRLYATNAATFGVLNPVTGAYDYNTISLPYPPNSFPLLEGIAYRPTDGALFGSLGNQTDSLIRLDPADGTYLETVGPFGIDGPREIVFPFVIPEPSTALLVLGGLITLRATQEARRVGM